MKKYFVFAVIIAAVTFSAFKVPKKPAKTLDTEYAFWYNVSSNTVGSVFAYDMTESEIKALGAPCADDGTVICLVGSNTELAPDSPINPNNYSSDQKIAHQ